MKEFKRLNNIVGWIVFAIASTVYIMTTEPNGSLWDCGEYISTAYKLQVGHPPGAPFFQLVGKFFSLFAPNQHLVAQMVNAMSALASGFTILFLFWTITHMARKLFIGENNLTGGNMIAVLGAGAVGALAYTFTDSFWFSAVEGEVYAMSSFFTAIVFWAILKWEDAADHGHAYRWLILIAYLMGLSIGVHLLNLLAIPAITFVYYFKKYKPTTKGIIFTFIISIVLLAVVMYMIIPWLVFLAGWFERIFINDFGLPFNTGTIIYFVLLVGGIVYGLYYTQKKKKLLGNTILLAFTFITIGYMSFLILVVRSNANTPIDENNPEDATSLLAYLNREQYGDWPLLYGQYFNAPTIGAKDKSPVYTKSFAIVDEDKLPDPSRIKLGDKGLIKIFQYEEDAQKALKKLKLKNPKLSIKEAYVITDERKNRVPVYDPDFMTIFPRMWSNQRSIHAMVYKQYMHDKSHRKTIINDQGKRETRVIPSFVDNLRFFFSYQIGHMYLRYFMWNFAGRQNDIQGHGDNIHGNWISGIPFLDDWRLGPQEDLPIELQNNKGHNRYFMLPLLLGLLGLWFHFVKDRNYALVVTVLFLMTGLAIIVYLNQYPYQPRERDYAYVASFYAFAIWIGFGVLALYDLLKKYMNPKVTAIAVTAVSLLLVPGIMAQQNWDDHDRSNLRNTLNVAENYLNTCEKNAIIFTNGDNDTFPLWYAQEVEGIRTDVKVVNLSLFNTDWYIDQMLRKTYDAEPIPFGIGRDKYIQGTNDVAYFIPNPKFAKDKVHYNIKDLVNFYFSDSPKTKFHPRQQAGEKGINYFPTKYFYIPVDKDKVLKNGTVAMKDSSLVVDKVKWRIKKGMIQKNDLMMLEMLASFNWDRPVYYAITTGADAYLNLMDYFQVEGMAYKLVPIKTKNRDMLGLYGHVNTDILYENLMHKFKYDGINDPNVYFNESHMRSIRNYRSLFAKLADALIKEGKNEKAGKVLDFAFETLPEKTVSFDVFTEPLAVDYYRLGQKEKADSVINRLIDIQIHDLGFYYGPEQKPGTLINEKRTAMMILQRISMDVRTYNPELSKKANEVFMQYYQRFSIEAQ